MPRIRIGPIGIGKRTIRPRTVTVDADALTASIEAIMKSPGMQGSAYGRVLQGETARAVKEHIVPAAERARFDVPVTMTLPEATLYGFDGAAGTLTNPLANILTGYAASYMADTQLYAGLLQIPAGGARTVKADVAASIEERANKLLRDAAEAGRNMAPENAIGTATVVEIQRAELQALRRSSVAYAMSMAEYAARGVGSKVNTDNVLMFSELLPPTAKFALQFYKTTPDANMDRILQNVNTFYATLGTDTPDAELAGLREFTQFMQGYVMQELSGFTVAGTAGAAATKPLAAWDYGTNKDNPLMGQYTPTALRGQAYAKAGFSPIESWMFHKVGPRI